MLVGERYILSKRFDHGAYGEVWLACHVNYSKRCDAANPYSLADSNDDKLFILKRIMVERGSFAYRSGLREKYFVEIFLKASSYEEGFRYIARYIESFVSKSNDIWLVFQNEGVKLSNLLYAKGETKGGINDEGDVGVKSIKIVYPSSWWHWLRTTEDGEKKIQDLIWQLLMALKFCHDHNITHRDIKPENIIICIEDIHSGRCLQEVPREENQYNFKLLEQTLEYTPPEALLNGSWYQAPSSITTKYDMWSVGVIMMELIIGSPHVFQISARTHALLDQHLEGWGDQMKELIYRMWSYMEMCILTPGASLHSHPSGGPKDHDGIPPAPWRCSEESFAQKVKNMDPLKLGYKNVWAFRFVRQLLAWHHEDRLSVDDALRHPYFQFKKPHEE